MKGEFARKELRYLEESTKNAKLLQELSYRVSKYYNIFALSCLDIQFGIGKIVKLFINKDNNIHKKSNRFDWRDVSLKMLYFVVLRIIVKNQMYEKL